MLAWHLAAVLDLAVDAIGEEASWRASRVQVGNTQDLGCCPGENESVVINWGQDVVPSGGVEDALVISDSGAVQGLASSRDGVDDGGDVGTVGSDDIAVLDEGSADVASVVSLGGKDTCNSAGNCQCTAQQGSIGTAGAP